MTFKNLALIPIVRIVGVKQEGGGGGELFI